MPKTDEEGFVWIVYTIPMERILVCTDPDVAMAERDRLRRRYERRPDYKVLMGTRELIGPEEVRDD